MDGHTGGIVDLGGDRFVDLASGDVTGPFGETRLEDRLARLLSCLVLAQGAVVSRDQLVDTVWEGRPVGDDAIDSAISRLRTALQDQHKEIVVTVHKRGYRIAGKRINPDPAGLCARGEMAIELWDSTSAQLALSSFEAVLGSDPTNQRALAGAALSQAMLCLFGGHLASAGLEKSVGYIEAANPESSGLGRMWAAKGAVELLLRGDGLGALRSFDRAAALLPRSIQPLMWRCQTNLAVGFAQAAVEDAYRAMAIDPLNSAVRQNRVATLFMARRYKECCSIAHEEIADTGGSLGIVAYKGWALMMLGQQDEAIDVMSKSWRAAPGRGESLRALEAAFRSGGARAYFRTLAEITSSDLEDDVVRPIDRAILWAMAGEQAQAIELIRIAELRNDPRMRWIAAIPQFDGLAGNPEFEALRSRHAPSLGPSATS